MTQTTSKYVLRPYAFGQHERWLASCVFIDAYLYSQHGQLFLTFQIRNKGKANDMRASYQVMYSIGKDTFGLFSEREIFALPAHTGALVRVDELRSLNAIQRQQLRRLIILLALALRARLASKGNGARYSARLHCLAPIDLATPLDGVRNHYETSARGARDVELARRVRDKRNT